MLSAEEWEALSLLIEEAWPYPFDDMAAKAWRVLLDDYSAAEVFAAIKACIYRGVLERPPVSAIVAEIRRDTARPTFSEAVQAIFGRHGVLRARTQVRKAFWAAGERDCLDEQAAWDRAGELHPLVGAFIARQGLERLRSLNLDDPEWGEARRRQLEAAWDEFVDVNEHREVAALVGGRRGELAQFDPLRALPKPREIAS